MLNSANRTRVFLISRITRKILLAATLCVLIILPGSIYWIESSNHAQHLRAQAENQRMITNGQAVMLIEPVADLDEESIFLTMTGILANPDIVGARVDFFSDVPALQIGDSHGDLVIEVVIQHVFDGQIERIGRITTYGSTRKLNATYHQRLKQMMYVVAALVFGIVLVLALTLRRFVGLPIQNIVDAIERNSAGEITQINWFSNDEFGMVVDRLNYLHARIRSQMDGLKQELGEKERREAARLRDLANATSEGILIYQGESILDLNEPMADLLRKPREILLQKKLGEVLPSGIVRELHANLPDGYSHDVDAQLFQESGHPISLEIIIHNFEYQQRKARVVVMRDITDRLKVEAEIRYMALNDGLTGLPNRMYFMSRLDEALQIVKEQPLQIALMYIDLDKFKDINDSMGHAVGDRVLREVSEIMLANAAEGDTCGRIGGDEFAVLMTRESGQVFDPEHLARKLTEEICGLAGRDGISFEFGSSIGLAIYTDSSLNKSEFLTRADLALYDAKTKGRNCYRVYTELLDSGQRRQRQIREKLQSAIDESRLTLSMQPQARTDTGEIVGFEALLRWHDDELGHINPGEILTAAQQARLVPVLGNWVIGHACELAKEWPSWLRLAVNMSTSEIVNEDLVSCVTETLERTGLPPARFEIEISEDALVADLGKSRQMVEQLKMVGVGIVLDDFGTGYSSLSLLRAVPFDRIKIAQNFVSESELMMAETTEKDASISSLIIELGRRLGVEIIAEGVETEQQYEFLKQQQCHYVQGYLIGRPLPESEISNYIQTHCLIDRKAG